MRQKGKFIVNKAEKKSPIKDRSNTKKSITKCQIFEFVLISVNRLLIGFITIYMCWMCLRLKYTDIPFHAVLCTLGVCMTVFVFLINCFVLICFPIF